jgi:cytochrome P450
METVVNTRSEIEQVLADPSFQVASVAPAQGGLGWLRSTVCRFTNGEEHARRRALVEAELNRLDPNDLRTGARRRTREVVAAADGSLDVMGQVARPVPLAVLCGALGVAEGQLDGAVTDSALVGRGYLTGEQDGPTDAAVDRLASLLARGGAEETAAALAVLAQACEATAALIGNALVVARERPGLAGDAQGLLQETLRTAGPLRVMRRLSPQGDAVVLDLEAASATRGPGERPMAFGSGIRPCPGEAQAMALALGVVEALLSSRVVIVEAVTYADSAAFRLPESIRVTVA